jgi:tetratricopeptide (TPR) repeat protein
VSGYTFHKEQLLVQIWILCPTASDCVPNFRGDRVAVHKKRLDSWKAIAEFLGRSLRTVQRWHEINGLPVHHFGGSKGSVFAYEEEIDTWLAGLAEHSGAGHLKAKEEQAESQRISRELTAAADSLWEIRSVQNVQAIADLYHKAVDSDPTNAGAYTGIANTMIFCAMHGLIESAIAYPIAEDALRRLSVLEPDFIDAKCPAAWLDLLYHRNWLRARREFEEVVDRRPSLSFAKGGLALSRLADGNISEAIECAWDAWKVNPLVRSLGGTLCWCAYLNGEYQRALDLAAQMKRGGVKGALTGYIEALAMAVYPDPAANISQLEQLVRDHPKHQLHHGVLGYVYGITGQEAKARLKQEELTLWVENGRGKRGFPLALVYLGLGENQQAISLLEAAYEDGSIWSLAFRSDPILRSLRGRPAFESLVSKIGVPDPYNGIVELGTALTAANPVSAVLAETP